MSLTALLGTYARHPAAPITNNGPLYLAFNFFFAYGLLSSRTLKQYYGIDHNVSPREDLIKYGDAAVREGKITRKQLDMLKRNEAAHANAVENFTLLVAGVLFATVAGVTAEMINISSCAYTVARVLYAIAYIGIEDSRWSQLRGVTWWAGNLCCLAMLWKAWVNINGLTF
ncbi:hypothetical protein ASPWEDRAFT_111674 [Aspergillus wentii DTO 134E9]|uniref:Uncharacterized protein n=1 Tax=Aspergillus wentii DTO 134E9 TaxID=1073089 RepID=A0A1L9RM59_ASPWE|nr:uncharacterized protein ASPWEDRAFT_111674 [Aspergillus wentii DTO 134E9]KAI9929528.1 hypothetical protein MW887_001001 [Aspergillus wentii]OJJ36029.1 hypothetical protein ASPWEDRAFT_111674 [Aspergillus wentii DTO 134E9]